MKKSFLHAFVAAAYIVFIVSMINFFSTMLRSQPDTILAPMVMLSLFVLSAAVMGFLFLSEPIQLYMAGRKEEAIKFFLKTVGIFACFVVIFVILLFLVR